MNKKNYKILFLSTVITILFSSMSLHNVAGNANDPAFSTKISTKMVMNDEIYVNDIPFNTENIAKRYSMINLIPVLEEEKYANDIPFDTKKISSDFIIAEKYKKYKFDVNDFINKNNNNVVIANELPEKE